jgi:serine/threonine protein kinase
LSLVGKSIGNYVIERKLGEGGMGEVYVARHPKLGKRVAVKVLKADLQRDEDALGRFFHEAKAVSELSHVGIVDILDFGTVDGVAYFSMQLLEGEDLASRITSSGTTIEEARRITMQCCAALGACHAKGIIHRDLKPENIFLVGRPGEGLKVKLLDFGLAKLTRAEGKVVKTLTGEIFGTPLYTSPEQAAGGSKDVGPEADVYSLGVILYELWTGQVPFPGETVTAIFVGHMTQTPKPPREWNPHLSRAHEEVVLKALAKKPSDRYPTAEAFGDALARLAPTRNAEAGRQGPTRGQIHAAKTLMVRRATPIPLKAPRYSRRQQRMFGWGALSATAILVVGVALGFALKSSAPVSSSQPAVAVATPSTSPGPVAPQLTTTEVTSVPTGAVVMRAGKSLGTTPLSLRMVSTEPSFEVEVRMPTYQPVRLSVDPRMSERRSVSLAKEALNPAGQKPRHIDSKHNEPKPVGSKYTHQPKEAGEGLIRPDFDK